MRHSPLRTHLELERAFKSEAVQEALPQIFEEATRGNAEDIGRFRTDLIFGEPGGRVIEGSLIHLDAPHGVSLAFSDVLMCYATFYFPSADLARNLLIEQIQGVKLVRVRDAMAPRDFRALRKAFGRLAWEDLLVRLIIEIGRQLPAVQRVSIAAAQMSNFLICAPGSPEAAHMEARLERFSHRYDRTAERLGFKRINAWEHSLDLLPSR